MPNHYVLSPELQQRPLGQWTAFYHREWGGLCLLDDDARDLLLEFSTPREIVEPGAIEPAAVRSRRSRISMRTSLRVRGLSRRRRWLVGLAPTVHLVAALSPCVPGRKWKRAFRRRCTLPKRAR